jgi:hemerythrin-like domain-containing protein
VVLAAVAARDDEAPDVTSVLGRSAMTHQVPSASRAVQAAVSEHRNLNRLVRQVEAAFSPAGGPHAGSGPDVVAARLDALCGPLRAHFDEEERAGLFEQIERTAPEQARACARLRDEHETILRRIDTLRAAPPLERRRPMWIDEVRRLLAEVHGHEARESDLLNRTLDGSTPAGD